MKTTLLLLVMALSISGYAQTNTLKTKTDSLACELEYMRTCMGGFNKQHRQAVITAYTGAALLTAGTLIPLDKRIDLTYLEYYRGMVIIGGAMMVLGYIIELDSYSWFKKASIKPATYGIGVSFDLDNHKASKQKTTTGY